MEKPEYAAIMTTERSLIEKDIPFTRITLDNRHYALVTSKEDWLKLDKLTFPLEPSERAAMVPVLAFTPDLEKYMPKKKQQY